MSANKTSIEWTARSLNPIRAVRIDQQNRVDGHFCQKISPGCANCYASAWQPRYYMPTFPGSGKSPESVGVEVYLDEKVLQSVLRIRKPCRIFWCDMSDLFGDWVPFDWIDQCFAVMALTPHITHQVLTKRAQRMAEYLLSKTRYPNPHDIDQINKCATSDCIDVERDNVAIPGKHPGDHPSNAVRMKDMPWPLKNVWLGVSVENQEYADERIPHLLKCPAAVRFLSCEPLLGPIQLPLLSQGVNRQRYRVIDWVIVGGESGGYSIRQMKLDWARSIRDQCLFSGVPFFYKQGGSDYACQHSGKGGCIDCIPEDLRVREFPKVSAG